MTVLPPTPPEPPVDERARQIGKAQPVRLVSIDEVTIGELTSLLFKLLIASIPVGLVVGIAWFMLHQIYAAVNGVPRP